MFSSRVHTRKQVRLIVAVHFRAGVLKQQLGNDAGARDVLHAMQVSKLLLGRFSVGQHMLRIVRDDGTLIPVVERMGTRTLSDNLNITGNLNASVGSGVASAAPGSFSASTQLPQRAASSIYSSASSLTLKRYVPEPDADDPTESLRDVSQVLNEGWNGSQQWRLHQAPLVATARSEDALDGTRDMWRHEFAPGAGRLQLPDVDVDHVYGGAWVNGGDVRPQATAALAAAAAAADAGWRLQQQYLREYDRLQMEASEQARLHHQHLHWAQQPAAWQHQASASARAPGSYANSPSVRNGANDAHYAGRFDAHAEAAAASWRRGEVWSRDGGSSVAAVASVRLADPDVVLNAAAVQARQNDGAGKQARAGQTVPLWSEHQASPIVDLLHQYLQQQHEVRGVIWRIFCGFHVCLLKIPHTAESGRSGSERFA
jgi:hypothetical protein